MSYGDELFRAEATEGHKWAEVVCERMRSHGVACHTQPLQFASSVEDRARFQNEQDISLDVIGGCIEVKSRRLNFTDDPASFPYSTAFVDTCYGWDLKQPKPRAVVIVSQHTGACLVVPTSTQAGWTRKQSFDRVRRISETWYCAERPSLRPFMELVGWVVAKQRVAGGSGLSDTHLPLD
jgi:hypothetical protein